MVTGNRELPQPLSRRSVQRVPLENPHRHGDARKFKIAWEDPDVQFNGVPAISGGVNRVYGTGAEESTGRSYVYGYCLVSDPTGPAGERVLRAELGKAPFRKPETDRRGNVVFKRSDYQTRRGEFYDAGNNIMILEDGSLILSGGRALARVRDVNR